MKSPDVSKKTAKPASVSTTAVPLFMPDLRLAVICAVLACILYANTIGNGYVLDDAGVITGNEFVQQGFKGIGKLLTTEVWYFQNASLGYYRPLSLITFAAEQQLFGGNAHISHLINVLLYAFTAFVLCILLMRLFNRQNPLFAMLITLVFVAHPIHTEVVANIKSRDELLSFLGLLLAMYALLRSASVSTLNYKWLVAAGVAFYLALLSKESALVGVAVAPVLLYFAGDLPYKKIAALTGLLIGVLVIYQLQKYLVVGSSGIAGEDLINYPYARAGSKAATTFMIFAWCIKMLAVPYPLVYSYAYNQLPAAEFSTIGALAGMVLLAGIVVVIYNGVKQQSPVALALILLVVFVAPSLGFVFLRGGIFAERFLYAPALGFAILLVWGMAVLFKYNFNSTTVSLQTLTGNKVFTGVVLALLLAYAVQTVARNTHWASDYALISHDAYYAPDNCQVHLHYGTLLINDAIKSTDEVQRKEGLAKGVAELRAAIQIHPHFPEAYYQLGQGYHKLAQNPDSAIVYYNHALLENPGYAPAYMGLATLYESAGKEKLASYYYHKAVTANPRWAEAQQYRNRHKQRTGLDVTISPGIAATGNSADITVPGKDAGYYNDMGKAYGERGDYENAIRYLQKSLELQPGAEDALVNLSVCYAMMRNYEQSIAALEQVLQVNPTNETALTNIAIMYNHIGDKVRAEVYSKRLQEVKNHQ